MFDLPIERSTHWQTLTMDNIDIEKNLLGKYGESKSSRTVSMTDYQDLLQRQWLWIRRKKNCLIIAVFIIFLNVRVLTVYFN